jgi:hypothetical protein
MNEVQALEIFKVLTDFKKENEEAYKILLNVINIERSAKVFWQAARYLKNCHTKNVDLKKYSEGFSQVPNKFFGKFYCTTSGIRLGNCVAAGWIKTHSFRFKGTSHGQSNTLDKSYFIINGDMIDLHLRHL